MLTHVKNILTHVTHETYVKFDPDNSRKDANQAI